MSNYTDVMLLVNIYDEDQKSSKEKSNIEIFNDWLKEEWPGTMPQLDPTPIKGVWVTSINNAADGSDLVEKFRNISWHNPISARLMLRNEQTETWTAYGKHSMTIMT